MNIKTYLQIASRNILAARRRSILLGVALCTVTTLLILLMSLSRGISDNLIRAATSLSAGHVNVGGFFKASAGNVAPLVTNAAAVRRQILETPGVVNVVDRLLGWGKVISHTDSIQAGLSGVDITEERRLLDVISLAPRSDYITDGPNTPNPKADPSRLSQPNTALIFANQAKRLKVDIGDALTLKTETIGGQANTIDVTVVAIARDVGLLSNFSVFVSKPVLRTLYDLNADTTGSFLIYFDDIADAPLHMAALRKSFEASNTPLLDHEPKPFFMKFEALLGEDWTGQKLDLTTWDDQVSFLTWIVTAVDTISFILIAILSVIIIIGIMNTMWIAVRERTAEIGTLRAIGMRKHQILSLFMTEALILGLCATTFGALLGAALGLGLDAAHIPVPIEAMRILLLSDTINLSVHWSQLFTATLTFTAITAAAAIWPSVRASRLQPVTAIHHVT
jgi:putative ABC transport system permease protein